MDESRSNLKVLMLPWLAHGHISAFVDLAKQLSRRNFHIYLCSTPISLSSTKKKIPDTYSDSIELIEIHLPSVPELPPHYHTTNGLPHHLMSTLKKAYEMASPTFKNIFNTLNPNILIYDYNQPWAAAIASAHGTPAVQFWCAGAAFTSLIFHLTRNPSEEFPFPEVYVREYEMKRLHGAFKSDSADDAKERDQFLEAVERSSKIILIKSFREIEGRYIDFLSNLSNKKMVPVGALVQESIDEVDGNSMEIVKWLDNKAEASTVFVSFGSEYFLSKEEIQEIACGLELSNVNFIWVVRFPGGEETSLEEALPKGFLERIGERGLVVEGWAPQMKILEHSSTGGFLSHCGWNSTMESMKCGVPIIAMPMHLDQPSNARAVVAVGVAVEIVREESGRVKREEIAQAIRKVVADKSGEDVRKNARELSESIRRKGEKEIEEVAEELRQLYKNNY